MSGSWLRVRVVRWFAGFSVVWCLWFVVGTRSVTPGVAAGVGSVLFLIGGCSLAGLAVRSVLAPGADPVWRPLVVGLTAAVVGDACWEAAQHGLIPQAGIWVATADLAYLASTVGYLVTVAMLLRRFHPSGRWAALDTLVAVGGPAAVFGPGLVGPLLPVLRGQPVPWQAVAGIYPLADLFIATALLALALGVGRIRGLGLLTLGFLTALAADQSYVWRLGDGSYSAGGWDWLWLLQYALLAAAARQRLPQRPPERSGRGLHLHLLLLLACSALPPAALLVHLASGPHDEPVHTWLAVVTLVVMVAVVARLGGLVSEHRQAVQRLSGALLERQRLGEELRLRALHDVVTGLPNRQNLAAQIDALDRTPGRRHSLVFVDLDDFKAVNDTFGHAVGDRMLRSLAVRLRAVVHREHLVARLGGDEFAVLMPDTDESAAAAATEMLLEALKVGLEIGGDQATVAATAGVAGMDDTLGFEDALARADLAMYAAKKAGKGRVRIFAEEMRDQVLGDAELAADLARAVESGEIEVAFQPVVDLHSGLTGSTEALARWTHRGRVVSPEVFLPIAEQRGMLSEIDLQVMDQALAQMLAWRQVNPLMRVACNVSAATLGREDFTERILEALRRHGVSGDALAVEITEQVVVRDPDAVSQRLQRLRDRGVIVALDDFGSGFSSLSYLQRFPIDVVKLDRSFVVEGVVGSQVTPLLRLVIELAQKLGMRVLVEGLETCEQVEAVRAAGCGMGQGWLFAPAVPAAQVPHLLCGSLLPLERETARSGGV